MLYWLDISCVTELGVSKLNCICLNVVLVSNLIDSIDLVME